MCVEIQHHYGAIKASVQRQFDPKMVKKSKLA